VADPSEAVVRRYYEKALSPGRFDRLDDLLTTCLPPSSWTTKSSGGFHRPAKA
jgi:hypothetical protein